MLPTPDAPRPDQVPLVVDLDGTLIRTDLMWESLARLLRRNPFSIFQILFWWMRGRAWLKQKLAARVQINPAALPYNEKFLAWLRAEKKSGRKIILATASDLKMMQPVADHVRLFDEVLASDGKINLRSENKLRALTEKFGARGFDYAGNSSADFAVWRGAREAVVVNASRRVLREAANCTRLGPTFCDDFSPFEILGSFLTELFWRSGYLTAILAGLLLASAFPKFNCAGFAWIAPALMLFAARGKNGADAARTGYVSGLAFWLASLYWLLLIPVTGFPILGWLALGAFCALFSSAWVWLVSNTGFQISNFDSWSRRTLWTLTGAAAWVALEMLRARIFGGFPWNLLGVSQFKIVPLIQFASVTGVYGVSFLIVWFSLALFSAAQMIFRHPTRRFIWQAEIVLPLVVTVICFVGGFFSLNRGLPAENSLRVTLIQPSVPQSLIWSSSADSQRFRELLDRSQRALISAGRIPRVPDLENETNSGTRGTRPSDLLLWPESAVPDIDDATYRAINQFAQSNRVAIILNGDDVEFHPDTTNFFNSAFLVGPDGRWRNVYHKRQLVIFGEYVPLVRWLPFLKWFTPITGGWTSGDKAVQFELERRTPVRHEINIVSEQADAVIGVPSVRTQFKTSPLICYEDMFPGTGREAAADDTDFLVNLTNDGWFGDSAEQWQHCAAAVFRAVENHLPLVRCANNGVSCLINADGRISQIFTDATGDVHGPGALTVEVPLPAEKRAPTFYHRHGDWFGWSCVAITLATGLMQIRRRHL
jgi:apolipoprotein N-acyltransferase